MKRALPWGLFLVLSTLSVEAQQQVLGDWQVLNLPGGGCVLHQRVTVAGGGPVLGDVFLAPQAEGTALFSLKVPVGASIADIAAYRHPGADRAVPLIWQSCDASTCLAQVAITEQELDRLRRGTEVIVGFVPLPGARPLTFSLSLMGVTKGLARAATCAG